MASSASRLVFFLPLLSAAFAGQGCGQGPISWGNAYSTSGRLTIPYAELVEPFEAWYDATNGRSRIDYYNGMVKTYQISDKGKYGTSLKLAPMTTEDQLNVETCFKVDGTIEDKIQAQAILPDLTGFQCIGKEWVNGFNCEKWHNETIKGEKSNKYIMYIRRKKTETGSIIIPVRYEMRGYNSLLGSHYDHYYLDYNSFSIEQPQDDIFKLKSNVSCGGFPGPGKNHIYSFNPMKEFINHHDEHFEDAWEDFKSIHGKTYEEKSHEHHRRKEVFRQNVRFIYSKNRANLGYQLAVNHLADKTETELRVLRGRRYTPGYNGGSAFPYELKTINAAVPDQYDWRLYGAVTPVKDQSVCGSCWSFGTTGAVEGAYFVKTGTLVRLSQQALIDCSWGYGNNGCDGGEDFRSYQWIMKHGGLPLESDYGGYLGQDGYCHVDKTNLTAKITGYVNVTTGDENALKLAIFKHGPISVAIDASQKTFSFYSNGVYYDPECKNTPEGLDHAVLAVGYGKIHGNSYWLVKTF
uniref:26,29 kDa proteinase-like cysteine protease n=1 Tax=Plautia stali TaxID=106108 RepID=A9CPH3_PLAST|nr:26,29 kDa proteinase-like cysteine protease [Plautia stali]